MMIKPRRLADRLARSGFIQAYYLKHVFEVAYVRRYSENLFELVHIHASGRRGEAVPALAVIGLTPGNAFLRKLSFHELVFDVAADKERGWTVLESDADAIAWEQLVADVVPQRCAALAAARGQELLDRSAESLRAVDQYWQRLHLLQRDSSLGLLEQLRQLATPTQRQHAERAVRFGAVMVIPGAWEAYDVASLAIQRFAAEVEGDADRFQKTASPHDDLEWLWRIEILASRVAEEPGWRLPVYQEK